MVSEPMPTHDTRFSRESVERIRSWAERNLQPYTWVIETRRLLCKFHNPLWGGTLPGEIAVSSEFYELLARSPESYPEISGPGPGRPMTFRSVPVVPKNG